MHKFLKLLTILMVGPATMLMAQPKKEIPFWGSEITKPVAIIMLIVIALLLGVIAVMSKVLVLAIDEFKKKMRNNANKITAIIFLLGLGLLNSPFVAQAQDAAVNADVAAEEAVATGTQLIGGLSPFSFYLLFGIIVLELLVVFILLMMFRYFMGLERQPVPVTEKKKRFAWIEKMMGSKTAKGLTDEDIDLGHDFDGISELDNPTPPWWRWGFVISVLAGVIYVWRYEVVHSAPNQYEELAIKTEEADVAIKAYLAKSANNVDENNVKYLTEAADIEAGKATFVQMCAACHMADGGGQVGPNLTDEYWLHGGSINDIFKTIKYGVVDKGMKSWKDDYSPKQMAQIASYVKSLQGTKPAQPKEAQGEKYVEEAATANPESTTTTNAEVENPK